MTQTSESKLNQYKLSDALQPLCPRDDHPMRFESKGIAWKALPSDKELETLPSYHCNLEGCSVRYDSANGYYMVVLTPDQPFFVEEPGVNLRRCPHHGTWLYRAQGQEGLVWRCGVAECHHEEAS
jgi:hypothetical protein